jgi:hypothetical protein
MGYMRTVMFYAFNHWEGQRFGHLFCDSLFLLHKFCGGWNKSSVRVIRMLLTTFLGRLKERNTVQAIKNQVGSAMWCNVWQLMALMLQFILFTGYDVGKKRPLKFRRSHYAFGFANARRAFFEIPKKPMPSTTTTTSTGAGAGSGSAQHTPSASLEFTPPQSGASAVATAAHPKVLTERKSRPAQGTTTSTSTSTSATSASGSGSSPPSAANTALSAAAAAAAAAAQAAAEAQAQAQAQERAAAEAAAAAAAAAVAAGQAPEDEEEEEEDDSDGEDMLEEAEESDGEKADDSKEAKERRELAAKARAEREKLALAKQAAENAKKAAEQAAALAALAAATSGGGDRPKRPSHSVKKSMHQIALERIAKDDEVMRGAAAAEDQTEFYLAVNRAHHSTMYKTDDTGNQKKPEVSNAAAASVGGGALPDSSAAGAVDPAAAAAAEAEAKARARAAAEELRRQREEDENVLYAWDNSFKGNLYLHVNKRDGAFEDLELAQSCVGFLQLIGCNHYEKSSIFSSHTREEQHELKYGHRGMCAAAVLCCSLLLFALDCSIPFGVRVLTVPCGV